jgi:hypothetical protein
MITALLKMEPDSIFDDYLTLESCKLKTSLEAPKPIFRLDFEHIWFDNYISDQSLVSLFDKQKVRNFSII